MTTVLPLLTDLVPAQPTPDSVGCGCLRTSEGVDLPLKEVSLDVELSALFATSRLRQRFVNSGTEPVEATYVFPLPSRGAVTSFVAHLGGRRIVGRLEERGKAREEYDAAIASGQRAALAEEDRPEVFTVTVGNVLPGEEAVVELLVTQPLAVEEQTATFRFPLVVAPRYVSGTPVVGDQVGDGVGLDTDAVPDASRVTPPTFAAGDARPDVAITVTVDGTVPHGNLRSSLHALVEDRPADGPVRLAVEPGERLDRDLVLRFDLPSDRLVSTAVVSPDETSESPEVDGDGTWSVTVVPPAATRTPRDVVVVLDRSGSMGGWKMVAARRAAARIVDSLDLSDRFAVLGFDTVVETAPALKDELAEASDRNRFAAVSWLGALEARGGTEMHSPLQRAASLLSDSSRERTVVLVTDGQVAGEDQILQIFSSGGVRVFCVGIDRAVNAGLLQRLSTVTGGLSYLVESEDRLDEALRSISRTVGTPSLLDVGVSVEGAELVSGTSSPADRPDAFAGIPLVVSGRYRGAAPVRFVVSARTASGEPFRLELDADSVSSPAVTAVWARGRVRDLEDRVSSAGRWGAGNDELVSEVVRHSLRFQVLSRYTAYVAVDPEETGADSMKRVTQPVESPSGWAAPGGAVAFGAAAMPAGAMPRSLRGGAMAKGMGAPMAASFNASAEVFAAAPMAAPPVGSFGSADWSAPAAVPAPRPLVEVAQDVRVALAASDTAALALLLGELAQVATIQPFPLPVTDRSELVAALREHLGGDRSARARLEAVLDRILGPVSAPGPAPAPKGARRSGRFWQS